MDFNMLRLMRIHVGGTATDNTVPHGDSGALTVRRAQWRNCQDLWIGVFQATSVPVRS